MVSRIGRVCDFSSGWAPKLATHPATWRIVISKTLLVLVKQDIKARDTVEEKKAESLGEVEEKWSGGSPK
jgi:hypothetical protein